MSDQDDGEYQFSPEDFEGDGNPTERRLDRAPLLIGGCIALGGLLLLAGPRIDGQTVAGFELQAVALAAFVFAVGLSLGGVVYSRRGQRRLGYAHGTGGLGWALVFAGTVLSETALVALGGAVVASGAVGLLFLVFR